MYLPIRITQFLFRIIMPNNKILDHFINYIWRPTSISSDQFYKSVVNSSLLQLRGLVKSLPRSRVRACECMCVCARARRGLGARGFVAVVAVSTCTSLPILSHSLSFSLSTSVLPLPTRPRTPSPLSTPHPPHPSAARWRPSGFPRSAAAPRRSRQRGGASALCTACSTPTTCRCSASRSTTGPLGGWTGEREARVGRTCARCGAGGDAHRMGRQGLRGRHLKFGTRRQERRPPPPCSEARFCARRATLRLAHADSLIPTTLKTPHRPRKLLDTRTRTRTRTRSRQLRPRPREQRQRRRGPLRV